MKKKYEKPVLITEEILEKVALACGKLVGRCKTGVSAS